MNYRARFWNENDVAHVIDFTCDNPALLRSALNEALDVLPMDHFANFLPSTVSPRAEQ